MKGNFRERMLFFLLFSSFFPKNKKFEKILKKFFFFGKIFQKFLFLVLFWHLRLFFLQHFLEKMGKAKNDKKVAEVPSFYQKHSKVPKKYQKVKQEMKLGKIFVY